MAALISTFSTAARCVRFTRRHETSNGCTYLIRYPFANILFICDGPWDIRDFIRKQCQTSILDRPPYLRRFIDLRKLYTEHYKRDRANLSGMLHGLGMKFGGREHSGLDDARTVTRIVIKMVEDGRIMKEKTGLKLSDRWIDDACQ
ncbi:3'-5' exoribonuclease 1 [Rhizophlyctis rosea]|nr:3'-5' exoribonuclease 1 [Rhizophlyctis rosea]